MVVHVRGTEPLQFVVKLELAPPVHIFPPSRRRDGVESPDHYVEFGKKN